MSEPPRVLRGVHPGHRVPEGPLLARTWPGHIWSETAAGAIAGYAAEHGDCAAP